MTQICIVSQGYHKQEIHRCGISSTNYDGFPRVSEKTIILWDDLTFWLHFLNVLAIADSGQMLQDDQSLILPSGQKYALFLSHYTGYVSGKVEQKDVVNSEGLL